MYKKYPQPKVQRIGEEYFKNLNKMRVQLSNGDVMVIEKGFIHDYTSVPFFVKPFFKKFSKGDMGAVAHDYMYTFGMYAKEDGTVVTVSRERADYEMAFLMRVYGDNPIRVYLAHLAVSIFGWLRWGKVIRQVL